MGLADRIIQLDQALAVRLTASSELIEGSQPRPEKLDIETESSGETEDISV